MADADGGGWFWDATTGDPTNNVAYPSNIQPKDGAHHPTLLFVAVVRFGALLCS